MKSLMSGILWFGITCGAVCADPNHLAEFDKQTSVQHSAPLSWEQRGDYLTRGLFNLGQSPVGNCLRPGEMKKILWENLRKNEAWARHDGVKDFPPTVAEPTKNIIFANPVHDLDAPKGSWESLSSGGVSIAESIREILKKNPGTAEVYMPVAQANSYFFGLFQRAHWATLRLNIENNQVKEATVLDSKGWLSGLVYDTAKHVKVQLEKAEQKDVKISTIQLGHQGLFNNSDCGRFSLSYLAAAKNGEVPENLTTNEVKKEGGFFSKLWDSEKK